MKLYIKNMVCNRCIMVVRSELEKFGLNPVRVDLGEVEVTESLNSEEKEQLNKIFRDLGFELMDDKRTRLIENIKRTILELVYNSEEPLKITFSEHISRKFSQDYSHLSKLFSEVQGITIEQYMIAQKIERVKELLVYDELSLSQIADKLHYSSVSHLSKQFKKVTGLTPTHFKQIGQKKRTPIDEL